MTNPIGDPGHGHSPAAWANVLLMLVGIAIVTLAWLLSLTWLIITGVVVFIIGPIVGLIMAKAGFGVNGPKYQPKDH